MEKLSKHTKIVFLDMDGVINCADQSKEFLQEPEQHCPELVKVLNGLSAIPDIKVVLSSTWRMFFNTVEEVNAMFKSIGIILECIGMTPTCGYVRGVEILKWIQENIECNHSEYKKYVILDDDNDMLLWQANHFFKVDHYSGITPSIVYKVKRYFEQWE